MTPTAKFRTHTASWLNGKTLLLVFMAVVVAVYWAGLYGSWLFDDYPNIVDNGALKIHSLSLPSLANAALSSPSSEFKRPLSSLTFALNYFVSGMNPFAMKLTNLFIHLVNGLLVFLLARGLMEDEPSPTGIRPIRYRDNLETDVRRRIGVIAALVAGAWMLLPINLTAVLYTVQRMESLANVFVLAGLLGYIAGRRYMLAGQKTLGLVIAALSLALGTAVGVLAKETAVMLPFYACLIEWIVYRGKHTPDDAGTGRRQDPRIWGLFTCILVVPLILGLTWQMPKILRAGDWATRDFTLGQRLLTEMRVVVDYIDWTLLPAPHDLSFYHDNFPISHGLLHPWTTLGSMLILLVVVTAIFALRRHTPLVSLGLALFLGCQLLTATILPLELVYEHRNYFASIGLMLALVPLLASGRIRGVVQSPLSERWRLARYVALGGLLIIWTGLTSTTAYAWGNPLRLAQELAARAPDSPRAQYGLGRMYVIYSGYNANSVFTNMAYAPLEKAMRLPHFSILPEQALIFFNCHLHRPLKQAWWDSMIGKLQRRPSGVQDENALASLTKCQIDGACKLPKKRMVEAFQAALSHKHVSGRLYEVFGDYAWNVLDNKLLGLKLSRHAVHAAPREPAYRITIVRMLTSIGHYAQAHAELQELEQFNTGGRLDRSISELSRLIGRNQKNHP